MSSHICDMAALPCRRTWAENIPRTSPEGYIVVLIIIGVIAFLCIRRKKLQRGYGNVDGHGNEGDKHGLNIELPEDDLEVTESDKMMAKPYLEDKPVEAQLVPEVLGEPSTSS